MRALPHCGPQHGLGEGRWWAMAVGMAVVLLGMRVVVCGVGGGGGEETSPFPVECPPKSSFGTSVGKTKLMWFASPVDHLWCWCLDCFVVMGFGRHRMGGCKATTLGTVTSKNTTTSDCACMYRAPMTLPAHLLEVSPTNPFNYSMYTVYANPRQHTVSNIL